MGGRIYAQGKATVGRLRCNDVAFMNVELEGESKPYVLALFAEKNENRLRAYPMEAIGHEWSQAIQATPLTPYGYEFPLVTTSADSDEALSVAVDINPDLQGYTPTGIEENFAYAFGMDVDDYGTDGSDAWVYVALGMHGLVRVRFHDDGTGKLAAGGVEEGPLLRGRHGLRRPERGR